MLIFDIGANIGNYSLSNINKHTKIISVEASPNTYLELVKNCKKYDNIYPLNFAVTSNKNDTIKFYECLKANTISTLNKEWLCSTDSRFGHYKNEIKEIDVNTITLDKLIDIYGKPDLIKIDVECSEHDVIKSLTQKIDIICFEWASEFKELYFECIELLEQLGFTKFHIQLEDNYIYRPKSYDYTKQDVINFINKTTPKKEWGMIWAI